MFMGYYKFKFLLMKKYQIFMFLENYVKKAKYTNLNNLKHLFFQGMIEFREEPTRKGSSLVEAVCRYRCHF